MNGSVTFSWYENSMDYKVFLDSWTFNLWAIQFVSFNDPKRTLTVKRQKLESWLKVNAHNRPEEFGCQVTPPKYHYLLTLPILIKFIYLMSNVTERDENSYVEIYLFNFVVLTNSSPYLRCTTSTCSNQTTSQGILVTFPLSPHSHRNDITTRTRTLSVPVTISYN